MKLHVLFDARLLHRPLSGLERVQVNVLRELSVLPQIGRLRVLVMKGTRLPDSSPRNIEPVEVETSEDILRVLLDRDAPPDVYHLTYFPDRSPRDLLLPLAARASVVEVHDAILNRHPEYHPDAATFAWYDGFVRQLVQSCDRLLVHSKSVAHEAVRDLGARADLIDVAPLAVDPELARPLPAAECQQRLARLDVQGTYFLAVGKDYPHKNHATLFRALALLEPHVHVVCAGSRVWHRPENTDQLLAQLGLGQRVRWLSGLDDSDMKALLQGSVGLVYPSLEEGFGLPPLEAMALGTLAIAANAMSVPEVCGEGAWLFDPRDHRALAALMQRAVRGGEDVAAQRARGRARAAEFSWARTATGTLRCYHAAVAAARDRQATGARASTGLEHVLRVIATAPYCDRQELRAWQERCHAAEQHARAVERNRDEVLAHLNEVRARNGQASVQAMPRAPERRPRWSLRRRWYKIKTGWRKRFGVRE
jgi:alpha-1,3-rhamnosyl/mannosyltransferase